MGRMGKPALVLVLALHGCGRSGLYFPPPDLDACVEDGRTSIGCTVLASHGLHLVDPISDREDVDPEHREPDGVFVVNPHDDVLTLQVFEIAEGDTEPEPVGDPRPLLPGEHIVVRLPVTTPRESSGLRAGGLLRLSADLPFAATAHGPYRPFLGNDSALLLPDSALGLRYVVVAYPPHIEHFQGLGTPTFFEIVAVQDDTEVRWRPRQGGTAQGPGVPAVQARQWSPPVILRRHEALLVTASTDLGSGPAEQDVSGTLIEASAPVRVVAGSRCSAVPVSFDPGEGCDPLLEQLVPVEQWGRTTVVPHPPLRTTEAHHVRIYAGAPGVRITAEPSVLPVEPYRFEDEGELLDVVVPHGTSFIVEADGPIMAVGYLQTRDYDVEIGDPAMIQLPPVESYLSRYTIATGTQWDRHFVQLTRRQGSAPVVLDGTTVDGWEAVAGWETAVVTVSEGSHVARSDEPFGLLQYGWNNTLHSACTPFAPHGTCQTSYAHPGGLSTRER